MPFSSTEMIHDVLSVTASSYMPEVSHVVSFDINFPDGGRKSMALFFLDGQRARAFFIALQSLSPTGEAPTIDLM